MFGIYTQFGLSSKYSCNKNCTIPYFIILISNRANFAVRSPSSLKKIQTGGRNQIINHRKRVFSRITHDRFIQTVLVVSKSEHVKLFVQSDPLVCFFIHPRPSFVDFCDDHSWTINANSHSQHDLKINNYVVPFFTLKRNLNYNICNTETNHINHKCKENIFV